MSTLKFKREAIAAIEKAVPVKYSHEVSVKCGSGKLVFVRDVDGTSFMVSYPKSPRGDRRTIFGLVKQAKHACAGVTRTGAMSHR